MLKNPNIRTKSEFLAALNLGHGFGMQLDTKLTWSFPLMKEHNKILSC